jgi:isoquinoline 1-oxidoreductase beta subunit
MADLDPPLSGLSRRKLLVAGGAGVGLVLAWGLWPRHYEPNLATAPGETVLNAFLKIGTDGRVIVVVPQAEMGQGIWTALGQALADELGADWRQIAIEPAPINPLYANTLLAQENADEHLPHFLAGIGDWAAREVATRSALMVTAGSTSIRAFELRFREAGAMARALLCMAAGARINADWRACDTDNGFVVRGPDRFRFGELAAEAAKYRPPAQAPLRDPGDGGIAGESIARIDIPAKIDGSARYAADVRLPGMVFAAIRHGPLGTTRIAIADKKAAEKVPGVVGIVENPAWVAALATNWWAADKALDTIGLRFETVGDLPSRVSVAQALDRALKSGGKRLVAVGDADKALSSGATLEARYEVPLAAHATIEPLCATARVADGRIELWLPTQAPGIARAAISAATGYRAGLITIYPMPVGGGFGRKIEVEAAVEAATLAIKAGKPVQLMWSRAEENQRARHRPPAKAHLAAKLDKGTISAWRATIAVPSTTGNLTKRLIGHGGDGAERAAIDGATPPYALGALAIAHAPADIGFETGLWRAAAHSYTCFFTESFVDELAAKAGADPLAFRMSQLGAAPRLARCLARVAAIGGWGERRGQGLACHSAFGSHIAVMAEIAIDKGNARVARLLAVVDCGRLINPDIARQQVESALIWGMAASFGDAVHYSRGIVDERTIADLRLPTLADTPVLAIEFISSRETPGGLAELGVPAVAPAIANALAAATGRRYRTLPFA